MSHKKLVQIIQAHGADEHNIDRLEDVTRFLLAIQETGAENTYLSYVRHLGQFLAWGVKNLGQIDAGNLTRAEIQEYISTLEGKQRKPATVAVHLAALSSFCRSTGQQAAVQRVRRIQAAAPLHPSSLSRREVLRLLRDVERDGDRRNMAVIGLLLETGIRVQELCNLNLEDIEIGQRAGMLQVRSGKGNKQRRVPLSREARGVLSRYLQDEFYKSRRQGVALFVTNRGTRVQSRSVQRLCRKYGTYPHALRHTFITNLVRRGVDLVAVARLAGHNDLNTTARYALPTDEELTAIMEKINEGEG